MANLPNDKLPGDFEIIIYGTGLTESILAAASARVGKSVLHIDSNSFYGELWGTLLYRDVEEWLLPNDTNFESVETIVTDPPLATDESVINITGVKQIKNVIENHSYLVTNGETQINDRSDDVTTPLVTWNSFGKDVRRFNYDLIPKALYCRGTLVDVITTSGCSRYMEFKAVNKLFLYTNDSGLVQVPSSRSDVFNSKIVSMLDKRRLMKYLTFCVEYEEHLNEYEAYQDKPYREFLISQGLSDKLCDFIIYSIAFADNCVSTLEGLKLTHLFLYSLGRFGNAPFIYPIFGAGEIPQAFCRLCAVYGGVYCLKQSLKSIITNSENIATGIICASGQRIKCMKLVCHASQLKHIIPQHIRESIISRAIYITDRSLTNNNDGHDEIAVVTVPPGTLGPMQSKKIQLLQLDSTTLNTSKGTFMVHAVYDGDNVLLLQSLADKMFSNIDNCSKPRLLRTIYFNITLYHVIKEDGVQFPLPSNITVLSDPDSMISYQSCIKEAQDTFEKLFPNEEFLPKIPEPEDVIYEDYQAVEDGTTEDNTPIDKWDVTSVDNGHEKHLAKEDNIHAEKEDKIPLEKVEEIHVPLDEGDGTLVDNGDIGLSGHKDKVNPNNH